MTGAKPDYVIGFFKGSHEPQNTSQERISIMSGTKKITNNSGVANVSVPGASAPNLAMKARPCPA
jgi:hypothetical protein